MVPEIWAKIKKKINIECRYIYPFNVGMTGSPPEFPRKMPGTKWFRGRAAHRKARRGEPDVELNTTRPHAGAEWGVTPLGCDDFRPYWGVPMLPGGCTPSRRN